MGTQVGFSAEGLEGVYASPEGLTLTDEGWESIKLLDADKELVRIYVTPEEMEVCTFAEALVIAQERDGAHALALKQDFEGAVQ